MCQCLCAFRGIKDFAVFTAIWWVGCLLPQSSCAQTDSVKARNLKDVEIRQYRISQQHLSPSPGQSLTGAELKNLNSLSVADAVRYFSGVQLKDYGGIGGLKTINVRSMGSNHTAVFYDGIQLGNAQNGQIDLGRYSLDNVEEISLYIGQKPQLLQPAKAFAAANALYIKTAAPAFKAGRKQSLKTDLKAGSFDFINPSIVYNFRINPRLSAGVNLDVVNSSGKYKYRKTNGTYDTTVVRTNADIFSYRLEGGLYAITADSAKWALKVYNYSSNRGIPGAIVSNKYDFSQRQWDQNFFVQSSYQNNENKKFNFLLNAKYANDFLRYLDLERLRNDAPMDNRYVQQEFYFSSANQYHLNSFVDVSLSADYSRQHLDANLEYFAYPTRHTGLIALATKIHGKRFELQANLLATIIDEEVKAYAAAENHTEFTPTAMFSLQPFASPNFRFRGFYKSIFRMPTFNDLYYTFIGNSSLRPEYTKQYDLGMSYIFTNAKSTLEYFSIETDAYFNQIKDKIVAVPTVNLFRWTMLNLDAVEIKGLEINLKSIWRLSAQTQLNAGLHYTYERALDVTRSGYTYGQQIPYIPVHSGSFTSGLSYKSYFFNYSYIYTGARYSQKANIPVNYVEPWYTHDFAGSKVFSISNTEFKITTEINNLFNQYYDVVLNYPMPGRNYRLKLTATF